MSSAKHKANWKIIEEHTYEEFAIFSLHRSTRVNPRTGKAFGFFRMDGVDWVSVIPLTSDNEVILVKQYRHGAEKYTIEVPGGCVDANEAPEASAGRELAEETGYYSSEIEHLGSYCPNAAMLSMHCHAFLARHTVLRGSQNLDAGEDIEVLRKPLPEVLRMISDGEIIHGITIAAFTYLLLRYPHCATSRI